MPEIKENFTSVNIYKNGNTPRYLVIHFFGAFSSAYGVSEWFKNPEARASAHYAVDEKDVIYHCVRDQDAAWHCGASGGFRQIHPYCRNTNSIGIEMRPSKLNPKSMKPSDKDWYFDEKVVENTIWLAAQLMQKYKIPIENVIRHWDVTGKICPAPYVGAYYNTYYKMTGDQQWEKFKERLEEAIEVRYNKLGEVKNQTYRKTLDKLIQKGLLQGKGGVGESRIIDLSEDMVRTLVILDRAGKFD